VQALSPRGRAVLVLRDVLGFTAREVAQMLDTSSDAVATQLSRARASMRSPEGRTLRRPTQDESALAQRFAAALTDRDVDAVVGILTEDVRIAMPPLPYVWMGLSRGVRFLTEVAFRPGIQVKVTQTAANRQPALAVASRRDDGDPWQPAGLLVLTVRGRHRGDHPFRAGSPDRLGLRSRAGGLGRRGRVPGQVTEHAVATTVSGTRRGMRPDPCGWP